MNTTYTIKLTRKPNGSVLHECLDQDGNVIGKRTSKSRVYPFCAVVRDSKSAKIRSLKAAIECAARSRDRYAAVQEAFDKDGFEAAAQKEKELNPKERPYPSMREWLEHRDYEAWANSSAKTILRCESELQEVESGRRDEEFQKPEVESWHGRLDLVKHYDGFLVMLGIGQATQEQIESIS
jgi:hypothetical protein